MKAYLIANITVTDPEQFARYQAEVQDVISHYGGRYLVRAGEIERREGERDLDRVVVLEFPSAKGARAFYESEAYSSLLKLRAASTRSEVWLAEGVPES